MSELKNKLGLWCTDTTTLVDNLHNIQDLGFDYIFARLIYHPASTSEAVAYEPETLSQIITAAATINLPIYAWAYVYPLNISQAIQAISDALPERCVNLVLDVEKEWESVSQGSALANQLAHGIAEVTAHLPDLHLSSFYDPNMHPLPYSAFLAHCESFMPQSYRVLPTSVNTVLTRTLDQDPTLAHQSLGGMLIPTVNRPEMLSAIAGHISSFDGASVWLWDGDNQDMGVMGNEELWKSAIATWKSAIG